MSKPFSEIVWDAWCVGSLVGVWPRFIEPKILTTTSLEVPLKGLKRDLRVAAFSDLHLHTHMSDAFLRKLLQKVDLFKPDLVFFLGDFLCDSKLYSAARLQHFLKAFRPTLGAFAVLGNHDYDTPVSINEGGDYDICPPESHFKKAYSRLTKNIVLSRKVSGLVEKVKEHKELLAVLKNTPFKLLNNHTHFIHKGDLKLNITGLGEHMLGRARPEVAFNQYQKGIPGIVLVHNPDAVPKLLDYPGDFILSGHTHGGQINLPWIWKKLTVMEESFKEGPFQLGQKTLYVSRGIGSVKPFRWYAPPELVLIHLRSA